MANEGFRIERDSMGELQVPADALWGAQTQRAVENFPISGLRMPRAFIRALGADQAGRRARQRASSGLLDADDRRGDRRGRRAKSPSGKHDAQFPIDVFQTGSGTSTQHECQRGDRARSRRARSGTPVHPNDHVNMGQSSNDVIPTAIHVSAALLCVEQHLLPALAHLATRSISRKQQRSRRRRQDRPHAPDGCDAGDVRPGAVRLAHADRARHRAPAWQCSRGCRRWRRAAPRSAPASTRIREFGAAFCARARGA